MKKNIISLVVFSILFSSSIFCQDDEILLTIDNNKVTKSEFERIYHKNNSSSVYDNKSVNEYLDLFINFKLKVIEAEALGYDTLKSFISELAGYREQLTKPYLEDKEITESIIQEAYYRTANIISASHILVNLSTGAAPSDTAIAYNKIMEIRKRIISGEPFDEVAKETSDDRSAKRNGGSLGWFGAFKMLYQFEDMAYKTPVGEISMPFRTHFGYHIVKNEGIKPAQGKVKLGYIFIKSLAEDTATDRASQERKAMECYEKLKNGEDFSSLAKIYSDEKRSSENGGILEWMSFEQIPPELEAEISKLKDKGDYTAPVPNDFGFHIFKLMDKAPIEPYEKLKPELEKKIQNLERSQKITDAVVERVRKENNYKEYPENLKPLIDIIDESIYDGKWDAALAVSYIDPVCSYGNKDYLQRDFAEYIASQKRYLKSMAVPEIISSRFKEFSKDKAIEYEKSTLEKKYPEFKFLMEEYHDGILLFNLTDDMVWSKAIKDTTGLENFYEKNKLNYNWGERAYLSVYTSTDTNLTKKILQVAKKRSKEGFTVDIAINMICGNDSVKCVNVKDSKIEKEDANKYKNLVWKKGTYIINNNNSITEVVMVNNILAPQPKKLDEARGLITADYQTYLENEWIKSLREKYKISVNQEVLNKVK